MKRINLILLTAFAFRLILSFLVWHPDVNNHIDWGIRFWQYGPEKFYSANVWGFTWPNQPPGTIYVFAAIRKLFEMVFAFFWWVNISIPIFPSGIITFFESNLYPAFLKLPSILADLGIGYLIYKVIKRHELGSRKEELALLGSLLWLANPVIWYNSSVWGQTDAVVNLFVLLSFYLLLQRKLNLSLLAFASSLYIKASLLTFVPIYAIVILRQKYKASQLIVSLALALLVLGTLTLPFSKGEPYIWLFNLYKDKVFTQQLQVITANAFNIWAAIAGIHERSQILPFLGLTYQYWGYILFMIAYFPALWLVYKRQDAKFLFWALAISAFSSFMLLTNMHERYLYPLFPYLTILVALDLRLLFIYSSISLINLFNLYNFWWFPEIQPLVNLMSAWDRLVPRILGLINFGIFISLYNRGLRLFRGRKI